MQEQELDYQTVSGAWETLLQAEAVFFDLDGCIYFSDRLAGGAKELLHFLEEKKKQIRFVTNNSTDSGVQVAARLSRMGLEVRPEHVMTATELVGLHLLKTYGKQTLKVIGSPSLHAALEQYGHDVLPLDSTIQAQMVVVGRDTEFDYNKLQFLVEEADRGTPLLATNPDLTHPGNRGQKVLETGALYAPVEAITRKKVDYFGKPAPYMFQLTMEKCGIRSSKACVMVGDNLYTDIAGGSSSGMKTIWLYGPSGSSTIPIDAVNPDYALQDLQTLADFNTK
ncbi:HAD-IIA family hydrolase [Paenibacillus qinlingensis]|uniref:HAD superfamily hydrolase (TIGR01450 family) n=1 Tax=Paenibacillus qinlingensis TaxID=1837343 RepID=A0ABU1NTP6_9BACL|nr:HAD-IIA family hydrolase [Paenibacillus qinlingensis]MDR6550854.1 HAD superfamily hydrolase (TIGR01450 family) [Paenibacillus qinlingensis]